MIDLFEVDRSVPDTRPICNSPCHETHCCPKHGCKYGKDDYGDVACPITRGVVKPVYGDDNGCELCEWQREEHADCMSERDQLLAEHEQAIAQLAAERDDALHQVEELTQLISEQPDDN